MRLWLIGMMGSGKSSAGRLASVTLGVPFHDSDQLVVERTGLTVEQLWTQSGETAFREHEKKAVKEMAHRDGIISTGGGVVLDRENRALLKGSKVVWLRASPRVLAQRLEGTADRPGLLGANRDAELFLAETLEKRTPLYEEVSTNEIDTEGLSLESIAAMIGEIWRA